MLNAPLIRYELVKAEQRARWQEAARARKARAATHDQAGRVEPVEAASDLTGLVERVIQNVWKRLGLPAREGVPRRSRRLRAVCLCCQSKRVAHNPGGSRDTCKSGQKILRQVTMFLLGTSLKPGFQKLDAIRISSTAHPIVHAQSFKTGAAGCATFFHDRMTSQFCT